MNKLAVVLKQIDFEDTEQMVRVVMNGLHLLEKAETAAATGAENKRLKKQDLADLIQAIDKMRKALGMDPD